MTKTKQCYLFQTSLILFKCVFFETSLLGKIKNQDVLLSGALF